MIASSGRVVGIDFGSKRIGLAVSDAGQSMASPLMVLERTGDRGKDHQRIRGIVADEEAVGIVVGMPLTLQGGHSLAAEGVSEETKQLEKQLEVPIETWDERMTTAAAHKNLQAQGVSSKKRRGEIDKFAAAVMLQGWLDARRMRGMQ